MTPTREEFLYFSLFEKRLFYVLIYLSIAYMAWQFWERVQLWRKGRPLEPNKTDLGKTGWGATKAAATRWARNIWVYVLAQKKVRSSRKTSGAPMHLALFYGFMTLVLATTLLGINTYSPIKFHRGVYYLVYEMVADCMGLVFLLGVGWAFFRRFRADRSHRAPAIEEAPHTEGGVEEIVKQGKKLRRSPITSAPSDYLTLALLFVLGVTGYWLEAARMSANPKPFDWSAPVGHALARLQGDWSGLPSHELYYKSIWWFHALLVMLFFCVLPKMRIRHILMAVASVAGKSEQPMGALRLISMEEVEATEQVGVKVAADYSRWHLMSLDACMECGRCTEVCPAWAVGKILNPKQVVQDVRAALKSGNDLATQISREALWACTTCNACVEACPVLIRHVDLIVDVRRNLVSEGALSGSAAAMLRQTASTSNAWGAPASSREDWMKGLDIPLCRDGAEFDWLLWVGCAGATDAGAVKTTKAVAALLKKAGIKFACLGAEESCTGDPARRVGEEFLFQEKAGINAAVFEKYNISKVVTPCPHCFNTFKNEYGELGRQLEVVHHSQLLDQLIKKGSLLAAKPQRGKVVLHDPCYLGRVNEETASPRAVLSDLQVDPEHSGKKTLCCGAGGGRMWMEEPASQRPSDRRARELVQTGAEKIAVACPFCRIMLGDAVAGLASESSVQLVDLAELVLDANPEAGVTA